VIRKGGYKKGDTAILWGGTLGEGKVILQNHYGQFVFLLIIHIRRKHLLKFGIYARKGSKHPIIGKQDIKDSFLNFIEGYFSGRYLVLTVCSCCSVPLITRLSAS
jgi:hypothetical protein